MQLKISHSKNPFTLWSLRIGFVLLVLTAAVVLVYFTPYPNLDDEDEPCDRKCHELEWPMICRIRLKLGSHKILPSCENCTWDDSDECDKNGCAAFKREGESIFTVNNKIAGPSIHVCVNDVIVVDVVNELTDRTITVHWRGQSQFGSPMMDGVPMVTQCPITPHTTFQYKFRAYEVGTHMWQLNAVQESDQLSNLFGMFVVRESVRTDILGPYYDSDNSENFISVSSRKMFDGFPQLIITEGTRESWSGKFKYVLEANKRHRFRVVIAPQSTGILHCPITISVDDHRLLVIALDGNSIIPVYVDYITVLSGERVDFVLTTDQEPQNYIMHVRPGQNCPSVEGTWATIVYSSAIVKDQKQTSVSSNPGEPIIKSFKELTTVYDKHCGENIVCLDQLRNRNPLPSYLKRDFLDKTIYLAYHDSVVPYKELNEIKGSMIVPCFNNISFTYPSSPIISQLSDIPKETFCQQDDEEFTKTCTRENCCRCTHIIHIPTGSLVEVVLSHHGSSKENDRVFHLHGHKFYISSRVKLDQAIPPDEIKRLHSKNLLLTRNTNDPVLKDTVSVPSQGAAAIRFPANNPGYWMLHEVVGTSGMSVILQVGDPNDVPAIPNDFPRCGNFIGPKYFLT